MTAVVAPDLIPDINASNGKVGGTDVASIGAEFKLLVPLYAGGSKRAQLHNAREAVIAERWELEAEQSRIKAEVRAPLSLRSPEGRSPSHSLLVFVHI